MIKRYPLSLDEGAKGSPIQASAIIPLGQILHIGVEGPEAVPVVYLRIPESPSGETRTLSLVLVFPGEEVPMGLTYRGVIAANGDSLPGPIFLFEKPASRIEIPYR